MFRAETDISRSAQGKLYSFLDREENKWVELCQQRNMTFSPFFTQAWMILQASGPLTQKNMLKNTTQIFT